MKIALIDDGINNKIYSMTTPISNLSVIGEKIISIDGDSINPYSHGSCCAAILSKYLLYPVELFGLKILHDSKGNCYDMIAALEWCIANHINIISMSIGTTDQQDGKIIKEYFESSRILEKILVVASQSNNDLFTYPASLSGVIGVKANHNKRNNYIRYLVDPVHNIEIEASAVHVVELTNQTKKVLLGGNSFATPLVCSCASNMFFDYKLKSVSDIKDLIKSKYC